MPPAPSKRYQSKVFNFFNQQSQQFGQKLENTIRSVKVATKFSLEAILSPLYQVLQTDKLVGKILQTATPSKQPQLKAYTPPATDAIITSILELVKNLPSAAASESQTSQNLNPIGFLGKAWEKISNRLGFSQSSLDKIQAEDTIQNHIPKIQGIAVKIENRNLVLVGENNKIFDVLTIQQQRMVAEKINIEIDKVVHKLQKTEAEILPEIDRLLNKLTNTNESSITDISKKENNQGIKSLPGQIFALLDQVLSKLENKAIIPVQKSSSPGIIKIVQNQLEIFVYGKEEVEKRGEIIVNSQGLQKQNLSISKLIEAAINYFFTGRRIPKISATEHSTETFYELPNQTVSKFTNNTQIQTSENQDLWLTWSDLYGEVEIQTTQKKAPQPPTQPGNSSFFPNDNLQDIKTEKEPPKLNPDWIETKAIFVGYEKHLLEKILEGLDHIMLWIEMIIMNMIYFFKGLLQG
ncbi:MAG: hypothetical protein EAZ87_17860 [Nostocales cyanobacterium]|nr:MAG: hypothetical protein EAZ87_17860 [Nostocales cyanobacterium]